MAAVTRVYLEWTDTSVSGVGNATDVLYGCVYNSTRSEFAVIPPVQPRSEESMDFECPAGWDSEDVLHIYGAWRQADGLDASDTMYANVN